MEDSGAMHERIILALEVWKRHQAANSFPNERMDMRDWIELCILKKHGNHF
jgi:hypothetical protein